MKHTLLIQHNLLAALFLDDLIERLKGQGWHFVGADEAFNDPVFSKTPNIVPAGESIIWALAKESGRIDKDFVTRLRIVATKTSGWINLAYSASGFRGLIATNGRC